VLWQIIFSSSFNYLNMSDGMEALHQQIRTSLENLSPNVLLQTYKTLLDKVKSKEFVCPFTDLTTPVVQAPEHFKKLYDATEKILSEKETCLYMIEHGYLNTVKQLFLEALSPCAVLGTRVAFRFIFFHSVLFRNL
jgi:hypothetical protein